MTINIPFTLTPKQKTWVSAIVAGGSGFLGWLFTLTPSAQTTALAPIIALLPPGWLGNVGGFMKAISFVSGVYSLVKAHSGTPAAQLPAADIQALAQRLNDEVYAKQPVAPAPAQTEAKP